MRAAIIESGRVENVIEVDRLEDWPGCVACPDGGIGDTWDGTVFQAPPSPPETPEQIRGRLDSAVQRHLDAAARAAGYDSIISACSYAGAPNPYQHEAIAFLAWRGAVWAHCYQVLADVESGARQVPSEEELIAELPDMPA